VTEVNPDDVRREHRYERLTWPEINEAVAQRKVIVLPVGSIEQHGHHLPLDVDSKLAGSVCDAAGARAPELMLVTPPMKYGYCNHVMDFPGTITIQPTTFVNVLLDIARSVAYHGFKRIVMVNGHGSNHPLVEQAGRQTNLQTDALCCTLSWWQLVADYWNAEVRESGPGGCAHACELETSMYLSLDPAGVRTDRIHNALARYMTDADVPDAERWQWTDLTLGSGPAAIISWTSSYSETGVIGSPELATAEKGDLVFTHAVDRLVSLVRWLRDRPIEPRHEHHAALPTFPLPFGF
jgi:creatinine amidohydrolase